jgi:two-component system, OmpR family, sensor histidine kinase CiaH
MGIGAPFVIKLQDRLGRISEDEVQALIEVQYADSQRRILFNLMLLNAGVFAVGALASYVLARRTLRPIEEALEAQNRFTADASHELRTPLAAMKTEIEVAMRDPKLSKDDMRELLQSNLEEIDRMSGLAQGLLTLARSGEDPHVKPVMAQEIVHDVLARMQPLADAKKITIKTDLANMRVLGDAKSIDAIVCILLDNAIKYSPQKSTITVSISREDSHGHIAIADQGSGISAEALPHVFDRFYRADSSRTKENVAGHGLGLSIAQKLVRAIGGTIRAQSAEGQGSTFTLRLPIVQ